MMNSLFFGKKNLTDFDAYVFERNVLNSPARVYTTIDVPGRNGSLVFDEKKFENVAVEYSIVIIEDAERNVQNLKNYILSLSGYQRLEDSFFADEYYLARFAGNFEISHSRDLKMAKAVLLFDRKPQRFLKSGEIKKSYTAGTHVLVNPTEMESQPLIRVYGTGSIVINDDAIGVAENEDAYIDIDSDLQDAYYESVNKNSQVAFTSSDFPVLKSGENEIIISGFTKVEITPRWWRL